MAWEIIESRFAPGLINVEAYAGPKAGWQSQQWALNSGTRKDHYCATCDRLIYKGTRMFAPLKNPNNRYRRICVQCVHEKLGAIQ